MVRRRQLRDRDEGDEERDNRWVVLYDDEALNLMQGWWGGMGDPLYAIYSSGGGNYAWVFQDAIANIDSDLARVKRVGRGRYQLGKGTFSKAEIDELRTMRDALAYALRDQAREVREHEAWPHRNWYPKPGGAPPHQHVAPRVADFSTLTEIIEHAMRVDGATHVLPRRSQTKIYYPRGDGQYEEACVWVESGYWHSQAPSDRKLVSALPRDAELIESFLDRGGHGMGQRYGGRHAAESRDLRAFGRHTKWSDWEILDSIDRGNPLPPEAERRGLKLAQLGFIDTTGTWRLTAKGRQVVAHRVPVAAESRGHTVRDYIAVDNHGRTIAGPFTDYGQAKREADRMGGYVRFESKYPPRPHEEELVGEVVAVVATTHPRMLPPGPMPDGPHRRRRRRTR